MPKTKPMTPEVREDVKRYLSASIEAYLREVASRYFKQPASSEAREILLEANAEALHNLTSRDPNGPAILLAFANELIEKETRR